MAPITLRDLSLRNYDLTDRVARLKDIYFRPCRRCAWSGRG